MPIDCTYVRLENLDFIDTGNLTLVTSNDPCQNDKVQRSHLTLDVQYRLFTLVMYLLVPLFVNLCSVCSMHFSLFKTETTPELNTGFFSTD
jgi:hypothetical protein